ncbi:hypothetical protein ACIBW9_00880 [Streptomyces sp. NPDC049541]|jgi:hypothetical protein
MSPHEQQGLRVLAVALAIILAGQFLSGVFPYLVAVVLLGLLAARFFGRR